MSIKKIELFATNFILSLANNNTILCCNCINIEAKEYCYGTVS